MKPQVKNIKSTPLKNARELAAMIKSLPRDDRLRIEGVIIWAQQRAEPDTTADQNSA